MGPPPGSGVVAPLVEHKPRGVVGGIPGHVAARDGRATGEPAVTYEEAIEEALCVGWVDATARRLDDERSLLWFTARRPRSGWSRPNKERVARLIAAGPRRVAETAILAARNERANQWVARDQRSGPEQVHRKHPGCDRSSS